MSEPLMDYDEAMERYDPVLGLEVHVELSTATKMFCACSNQFGDEPNTNTCPVCLGLPGALPVVNGSAVEAAIRIGLALNCQIAQWCRFARKNYFYPDMTKNFQTSQYDEPIAFDGSVEVELDGRPFAVPIERAHMEEDAGKLTHFGLSGRIQDADYSLIDYNRAGTPLIEIVTKPVFGAGADAPRVARAYVAMLRDLMKALGVSDVRMEQGSLRCDANVSLMPKGSVELGTRTETKNVNSLRSIERALTYEIRRQAAVLASGGKVRQETRHWHEEGFTSPGRSKEEAEDYRYFPEPDLPPVAPSREWVEQLRATLPEPPAERRKRLAAEWGFSALEMRDVVNADALDLVAETVEAGAGPQAARKWWMTDLARRANEAGVELAEVGVSPAQVAQLQELVEEGVVNDSLARKVLDGVVAGEGDPRQVVEARGLAVVSNDAVLEEAVEKAVAANADAAQKVRDGKQQAMGAIIGAVMRELGGKADAAKVRELIVKRL
ncbi:MAG: Asp-tRNA(Asn)/Glu-tRNA(Gln) amidotransferase subunit GatB [Propionibacteriaceae bacterium]|jgi:aspartyl-tRNA(Asn)/glutamyl-tRNA(Gln) amidotransferase subunit B|nr:Asp-tRNA(Asn)/Glu-tRNA(Gln) amidotransferase subunit GatB [Propionibacteriaceae bacterium]